MRKKKIIIVHSNADTADTIKKILEKEGYAVEIAKDMADCTKRVLREESCLVLTEAMLPRESILKAIKKKNNHSAILYLAGDDSNKDELQLYKNVLGFVEEPLEIKKFLERVKEAWKRVG